MSKESRGGKSTGKKKHDAVGRGGDVDRKILRAKELKQSKKTIAEINSQLRLEFGSGLGRAAENAMRDKNWTPGKFHLREPSVVVPSFKEEAKWQVRAGKQKQINVGGMIIGSNLAKSLEEEHASRETGKEPAIFTIRRKESQKLLEKGMSPEEVARQTGIGVYEARVLQPLNFRKQVGIKMSPISETWKDWDEQAKLLLDKGVPAGDVSRRVGIDVERVERIKRGEKVENPKLEKIRQKSREEKPKLKSYNDAMRLIDEQLKIAMKEPLAPESKPVKLALNWKDGTPVKSFILSTFNDDKGIDRAKMYVAKGNNKEEVVVEFISSPGLGMGFMHVERHKFRNEKDARKRIANRFKTTLKRLGERESEEELVGTTDREIMSFPTPSEDAPGFEMEFDKSMMKQEEKKGWI